MKPNKQFFEKVFSNKRMERYFALYPHDEDKAIKHYQSNIQLTEAFYTSLSVLEVALRNALNRELQTMTNREDWYAVFPNIEGLSGLNKYITQASKQIANRHEQITPSKIVAELTLGFWVSLLNAEYERILWKDLRRAFPYLPKKERQRKIVSAPLNRFRSSRLIVSCPMYYEFLIPILHQERYIILPKLIMQNSTRLRDNSGRRGRCAERLERW